MTPNTAANIISKRLKDYTRYKQVVKWAIVPNVENNILTKKVSKKARKDANELEKNWGNKMIGQTNNGQWTTNLGEGIVKEVYERKGQKIWRPKKIGNYKPDWETEDEIIEVKTRNWTTPGTIGEKVFGTPYKYSDIPRLTKKPLKIVCIAYQEYELTHGNIKIFSDDISKEKKGYLQFVKSLGIEYVPFSKLLE